MQLFAMVVCLHTYIRCECLGLFSSSIRACFDCILQIRMTEPEAQIALKRKNKLLMQGYAYFRGDERCSGYMYKSSPGQGNGKPPSTEQYVYTQARLLENKHVWTPRLVYCSREECPTLAKKRKVAQASPGRVRCVACGTAPNACLCPVEAVRTAVEMRKRTHGCTHIQR